MIYKKRINRSIPVGVQVVGAVAFWTCPGSAFFFFLRCRLGGPWSGRWWWLVTNWWTGWWFQTCLIFHNVWDNPSHWLIFFRGVETTNQWKHDEHMGEKDGEGLGFWWILVDWWRIWWWVVKKYEKIMVKNWEILVDCECGRPRNRSARRRSRKWNACLRRRALNQLSDPGFQ